MATFSALQAAQAPGQIIVITAQSPRIALRSTPAVLLSRSQFAWGHCALLQPAGHGASAVTLLVAPGPPALGSLAGEPLTLSVSAGVTAT